jgi:proton-dependent oligopeptide transporter, POT family
MSTVIDPASDRSFFGHPRGLSTLFFTEMWERFSFYGIRPLLVLFMTAAMMNGGFGFERTQASAIVGIYASSVYLASLPGGWIADKILGLRTAVMYGGILIALGHICIGLSAAAGGKVTFFLGLILIVMGTGLLKPNISAIVGDLYPEGGARRDAGFAVFYMGINLGSFLGQIVAGALGENVGWHWGFGSAGVGMIIGIIFYIIRSRPTLGDKGLYRAKDPDPVVDARKYKNGKLIVITGLVLFAIVFAILAFGRIPLDAQVIGGYMTYVLVSIAVLYFLYIFIAGKLNREEMKRILVIAVLFVAASIFWAAFEQAPTSLNLFAKDFTDRNFWGFEVPATWYQSINSIFVIILAAVFAWVWGYLGRHNVNISSPFKFSLGLFLAGVGFFIMIFAANILVASGGTVKVSSWWLIVSYLFQSVGEILLSPVGLSSMTKLSPKRFVGQMMGIWFLATSLGNLIAGLVGGNVDPEKLEQTPLLFTTTTIALIASSIVLAILAIPIARMMRNVPDEGPALVEPAGPAQA